MNKKKLYPSIPIICCFLSASIRLIEVFFQLIFLHSYLPIYHVLSNCTICLNFIKDPGQNETSVNVLQLSQRYERLCVILATRPLYLVNNFYIYHFCFSRLLFITNKTMNYYYLVLNVESRWNVKKTIVSCSFSINDILKFWEKTSAWRKKKRKCKKTIYHVFCIKISLVKKAINPNINRLFNILINNVLT